ncbi:MAG: hypothetical protein DLM58_09600 [Pseudonocardiales bacterium]|nr:MAG: hypothetical protein DLM58_09600 [Pseudonocardiales bacterium]
MTTQLATARPNAALPAALAVFEAINAKDLSRIPDLVTGDFIDHGSPVPLPPGPDGYRRILTFVVDVLAIQYTIEDIFSTDDRIVVRAVADGVAVAAVHGQQAAGKPYRMNSLHVYRTEGERLAEHWAVRDEYAVMIQTGVLTPPALPIPAR